MVASRHILVSLSDCTVSHCADGCTHGQSDDLSVICCRSYGGANNYCNPKFLFQLSSKMKWCVFLRHIAVALLILKHTATVSQDFCADVLQCSSGQLSTSSYRSLLHYSELYISVFLYYLSYNMMCVQCCSDQRYRRGDSDDRRLWWRHQLHRTRRSYCDDVCVCPRPGRLAHGDDVLELLHLYWAIPRMMTDHSFLLFCSFVIVEAC